MSINQGPNIHPLKDSGAYGDIPSKFYLDKIEVSNVEENPDQVEDYYRLTLADYRPDSTFLASDEERKDKHSDEFLSLRYSGDRSEGIDPYLPDGAFTDWDFALRDPRSLMLQPDMRKHTAQQYARASYIKFSDDSDWSVPGEGITPYRMVENIKSGFYPVKDRLKIYDESMDNWHNGGINVAVRKGNDLVKITSDGTIVNLAEASQANRSDAVNQLSNDPTTAFRHSMPDQRVKISRYGLVRTKQHWNDQNWENNRLSSFTDHANMAVIDGQLAPKMLAHLIVDLEGLRQNKQEVAKGAQYNDSLVVQERQKKLSPDDIYKIIRLEGMNSQEEAPNVKYEGKMIHKYNNKPKNENRKAIQNIQINHEITKSMELATKKSNRSNIKDLRETIVKSAHDEGLYNESKSRRILKKENMKTENQNRHTNYSQFVEDTKTVKNYSGIKPSKNYNFQNTISYEEFALESRGVPYRKGANNEKRRKEKEEFENSQDTSLFEFGVYDKADKMARGKTLGRPIQNDMDYGDSEGLDEGMREVGLTDIRGIR